MKKVYGNTSGSLGEREIEVETRGRRESVSTLFQVLPNFHGCFYNVWEHVMDFPCSILRFKHMGCCEKKTHHKTRARAKRVFFSFSRGQEHWITVHCTVNHYTYIYFYTYTYIYLLLIKYNYLYLVYKI